MAPTLLIVDDHDHFRLMARTMLAAEGFDVVGEAADGAAAIRAAGELTPDVILLDVALSDIDGFVVCAHLAKGGSASVVVLTSSRDASSYRRQLRASSARGFIPKSELSGVRLAELVR